MRITGGRAQILAIAVRHANTHAAWYSDADDAIAELGISAEMYREAVQELDHLGVVITHLNGNHASGFGGVGVRPVIFVALVGQVVPGVLAERELGQILDVFRRTVNASWVRREEFEALAIPVPRLQRMLQYLENEEIVHLDGPGDSVERLLFLNAQLLPRGRRILRGDENLG